MIQIKSIGNGGIYYKTEENLKIDLIDGFILIRKYDKAGTIHAIFPANLFYAVMTNEVK